MIKILLLEIIRVGKFIIIMRNLYLELLYAFLKLNFGYNYKHLSKLY